MNMKKQKSGWHWQRHKYGFYSSLISKWTCKKNKHKYERQDNTKNTQTYCPFWHMSSMNSRKHQEIRKIGTGKQFVVQCYILYSDSM